MLSRGQHDAIVERLYASALGDSPWLGTLRHMALRFGASGALIQVQDAAKAVTGFATWPFSEEFSARFYASEVYRNDPRFGFFRKVRPGRVYFDSALYDVAEMGCDPHVRASNDALGSKYSLGAVAGLPNGASAWLSLLSSEAEGHASEAAIAAYRRLAPHIEQALALGLVVQQRAATQAALLDALAARADGIILLGSSGAPSFMNDAALFILGAGDGLAFVEGAFVTRRANETRKLHRLIAAATAPTPPCDSRPGGELLVTRASGSRPYVLRVMPAPPTERFLSGLGIACVIHLHDLAALRLPSRSLLVAVFGLSDREADLAVELVRCASLTGAAAHAGMALNTARNHLQSVFRKSGTASQAEAVQLFSRLA
jgi:DNA-binding CsgD family transcriptional regulator/PAS domain-containing protein